MNHAGTAITLGSQCLLRRQSNHRPRSLPNSLGLIVPAITVVLMMPGLVASWPVSFWTFSDHDLITK